MIGGLFVSILLHASFVRFFEHSQLSNLLLLVNMDPNAEEELDYGDDEHGGSHKLQHQGSTISALADEEPIGEDDEYDDLYNDVNVGEGFMQTLQRRNEMSVPVHHDNGPQGQNNDAPGMGFSGPPTAQNASIPGVGADGKGSNETHAGFHQGEQKMGSYAPDQNIGGRTGMGVASNSHLENQNFRGAVPPPPKIGIDPGQAPNRFVGGPSSFADSNIQSGPPLPNHSTVSMNRPIVNENSSKPVLNSVENGTTMLFVGELHWWTTDAELESVLSQYGRLKEIKFFDERASGKSKGYCQVEFCEASAAAACKESMNGHLFNGRACVVAFASPQTLKQMGAAYLNKTQAQGQSQGRRPLNDGTGRGGGMEYQSGDGGRNFGKTGWGRGGQGYGNRVQGGGPMRGRGSMGGRGMAGSNNGMGSGASGGGPYGQGIAGPGLGGPAGGMMHPQSMMGAGFDPTFMGRGAGFGGFAGPTFPGMMPSFPVMNTVALPGVAPHVNPAFFGRGMSNGMGMMAGPGMDGHMGMWNDPSMAGWGNDEHGRRTRESSYGGDDGTSEQGYGDATNERGGRTNASRERERTSERDWSGSSERRHRDERDIDRDRSERERYHEEKDGYRDHHKSRDRDRDIEDNWDKNHSSSRSRSKSRIVQEDEHRSRTRDADYGKRRRVPSD